MYTKVNNSTNQNLILRDNLFCQYCNKQCHNLNSLKQHEIRCKQNPNKIKSSTTNLSNLGWAKGLTKDTDQRVAASSLSRKGINGWLGKHHTEETKKKISNTLLEYNHSNNQRNLHSKGGWYNNIYFMSTWELAYYIYQIDAGKDIQRCTDRFEYYWENKKHYYTPDFIIDNVYIEIKGKEWSKDLVKYEAVKNTSNNIEVLSAADIDKCIQYVLKKYNIKKITELYVHRDVE